MRVGGLNLIGSSIYLGTPRSVPDESTQNNFADPPQAPATVIHE